MSWRQVSKCIIVTATVLVGACASTPAKRELHPIVAMAEFDLNCPRSQLSFKQIDAETWGAVGCGKRTKYVRLCRQVGTVLIEDQCRWVAN